MNLTFVPPLSAKQRQLLSRFLSIQIGDIKMDQHDQELLSKQMRTLRPPENYGAIAVILIAMFLIGITLGSALSEQQTEPIQIVSMD
jgi:hypothetical protein